MEAIKAWVGVVVDAEDSGQLWETVGFASDGIGQQGTGKEFKEDPDF